MSRLEGAFREGRKALIGYVTVGYPSLAATLQAVPLLAASGCDIIELGIPFSDPLADGITIQQATYQALLNGATPARCLETAGALRQKIDIPLLFMTYFNPVLSYGLKKFCADAARHGVDGMIVPDLPPEEGGELEAAMNENGLDPVYMLAPTSTEARIKLVAARARGFIYLVSVAGVTGARDNLPADLEKSVARVRKFTAKPLCVGFGIASPEQAKRVAAIADGVIVGSRIVQLMNEDDPARLADFIRSLRASLDSLG